jgi:hypothetical protein
MAASMDMISQSSQQFNTADETRGVALVMDMKDEMENVDSSNVSAFSLDSLALIKS